MNFVEDFYWTKKTSAYNSSESQPFQKVKQGKQVYRNFLT